MKYVVKTYKNKTLLSAYVIIILLFCLSFVSCSLNKTTAYEIFPFDNGVGRGIWTPEQQAEALREFGYTGIGYNYTNNKELSERLTAMEKYGIKFHSLYVASMIGRPDPLPEDFEKAVQLLNGHDIIIWLNMSAPKNTEKGSLDEEAVGIVRKVSEMAKKYNLRVALYGHRNLYIETAEDGLRILQKAECDNVGNSFNLCHELMYGNANRLKEVINKCAKNFFLVSINGADLKNGNYIMRLDQGDFDILSLLHSFRDAGYQGPIGLQCYNVPGDQKENLKINMAEWKRIISGL